MKINKGFFSSKVNWMGIITVAMAVLQYLKDMQLDVTDIAMFVAGILLVVFRTTMKAFDVSVWSKKINWVAVLTAGISIAQIINENGIDWKNPWGLIIAVLTIIFGKTTTKPIKGVV